MIQVLDLGRLEFADLSTPQSELHTLQGYHSTALHSFACDVTTPATRREEEYQVGQIIWLAKLLLKRNLLFHIFFDRIWHCLCHFCIYKAWQHAVDTDLRGATSFANAFVRLHTPPLLAA